MELMKRLERCASTCRHVARRAERRKRLGEERKRCKVLGKAGETFVPHRGLDACLTNCLGGF